MKTVLSISDEQAQKQLKKFTLLGLPFSIVGFFIFGWLGAGGIMFGGRALVLSFHKGNRRQPGVLGYCLLAAFVFLLGLFDSIWLLNHLGK